MNRARARATGSLSAAERTRLLEEQQRYMQQRFNRSSPGTVSSHESLEAQPTGKPARAQQRR
jgi:hypothetical protein